MAGKKRYGAFAGVFTPSILTILGVIMYMRLGWVVGNAGLIGTIGIIIIAHLIAITTGLSVSSVATNKKIGAGGIYYVLSRSMGIPIGGAIGIALYVGTALSIALYLIGFAESFNGYFGLGMTVNDFRITGTIALISVTTLALISTSVAIKAQFFILTAIIISLVSIFLGTKEFVPETVNMFTTESSVSLNVVFAIFFPAVTGFTAGIAMSGDLKDPKKSIPSGTLLAIAAGLVVYIGLAIFLAYTVNSDLLKGDYNIMMKIARWPMAVVIGIWGATLSSALGGILGGPRILQAMSVDKVTPSIFGLGKGKDNEPVNALFLVFLIAEAGILIGELDVIARVVSMFYLTAYGFINISYFLESWANPDFQPTFKIKRWIGLVGFVACFAVMFQLDPLAMVAAFAVISGLYVWLQRKQIKLQSNDVWQSVWSNVVNKGLKKLESKEDNENWNPNIILFTGETKQRKYLLEFSKVVSGRTGIVTDFKLVNSSGDSPMSKNKQSYKDLDLDKLGIYGRKVEVDNYYSGIENIASTYGFTGVEPNTIMMNWSRNTKSPEKYVKMTQRLIHLDYNLLYLDYDERTDFGKFQTIDLWWRDSDSNNAELMLNIARYISQSAEWAKAKIRVLFVNHNNADNALIKSKINNLIKKIRIDVEIKVINNGVEQKSFYKIIELQSANTDLIVLGIPKVKSEKQAEYILNTDHLFEVVGTTLLVRASHNFNILDLDFDQAENLESKKEIILQTIPDSDNRDLVDAIYSLDNRLSGTVTSLIEPAISTISAHYFSFVEGTSKVFEKTLESIDENHSPTRVARKLQVFINHIISSSEQFKSVKLSEIELLLKSGLAPFIQERDDFFKSIPKIIFTKNTESGKREKIYWKEILNVYNKYKIIPNTDSVLRDLGIQNYALLNRLTEGIKEETQLLFEKISTNRSFQKNALESYKSKLIDLFSNLRRDSLDIEYRIKSELNHFERDLCVDLIKNVEMPDFYKNLQKEIQDHKKKELRQKELNISEFAADWSRNQSFFHNQLQSDFALTNAGISVFIINEMIKSKVQRSSIKSQKNEIELFAESIRFIGEHLGTSELDHYSNKTLKKLVEGIPQTSFNELLKNEEDKILTISGKTPVTIPLMTAQSIDDFQNIQNDDVEDVNVNLSVIQNHLIQSSYLTPLQDSLSSLEKIFKSNAEKLYTSSNLVKYILSEDLDEESVVGYKKSLKETYANIEDCLKKLVDAEKSLNYNLSDHISSTFSNLRIRSILESIDSYDKISSNSGSKSKIRQWSDKQKNRILKKYNEVTAFVVQRKRNVDNIKFTEKHNQYLNKIERTNQFVRSLSYNNEIEDEVSFYYKKLFTGSHLGSVNPLFRKNELEAAKMAVSRINQGVSGAVLVLGESLSGKSYFIETITNTLIEGEKIFIQPPSKQNYNTLDVDLAFQHAFNDNSSTESILNQRSKVVLVIENIEKWWVKAPKGEEAIDYLTGLIEMFGNKHYFILSCNIYSFDLIRQVSSLEKQLISTIIIPPVSKVELKKILLNRHRTGGAELWYRNQMISESMKADSFFSDMHQKSKGNIGIALTAWISSMDKDEQGHLSIKKPTSIHFPPIDDPKWKIILYMFVLHGSLAEEHIIRFFGQTEWVLLTMKELEKTALISKVSATTYTLNHSARHFIEEWLKELKILN